jgi:flavin reductase (DIM6/NTAB) family NADH-FMN oxidoreductase RutF
VTGTGATQDGGTMPDDGKAFRRILGHYPTGVCAVTAMSEGGKPVGLVVGSFTSVSLKPMLVAFFPDRSSTTWPKVEQAGRFCVNVLGDGQQDVCRALAAKGDDKFAGINFRLSELGSPIIHGALAWIDCELETVHEAGDHYIVLGRVRGLDLHHEGSPLIFHKGGYSKVLPI